MTSLPLSTTAQLIHTKIKDLNLEVSVLKEKMNRAAGVRAVVLVIASVPGNVVTQRSQNFHKGTLFMLNLLLQIISASLSMFPFNIVIALTG